MLYFLEAVLFLLPLAAFLLWRRANPGAQPGWPFVLAAALAALLGLGSLAWFGLSHSLAPGRYVAPHMEDGRLVPGHTQAR